MTSASSMSLSLIISFISVGLNCETSFFPYSRSLYDFIEGIDFTCNQEFGHGGRQDKELGDYFIGIPQSLIGGRLLKK